MHADSPRAIGYAERARWYRVEQTPQEDQAFLRRLVTEQVQHVLIIPSGVGRCLDWLIHTRRQAVLADLEPEMVK